MSTSIQSNEMWTMVLCNIHFISRNNSILQFTFFIVQISLNVFLSLPLLRQYATTTKKRKQTCTLHFIYSWHNNMTPKIFAFFFLSICICLNEACVFVVILPLNTHPNATWKRWQQQFWNRMERGWKSTHVKEIKIRKILINRFGGLFCLNLNRQTTLGMVFSCSIHNKTTESFTFTILMVLTKRKRENMKNRMDFLMFRVPVPKHTHTHEKKFFG